MNKPIMEITQPTYVMMLNSNGEYEVWSTSNNMAKFVKWSHEHWIYVELFLCRIFFLVQPFCDQNPLSLSSKEWTIKEFGFAVDIKKLIVFSIDGNWFYTIDIQINIKIWYLIKRWLVVLVQSVTKENESCQQTCRSMDFWRMVKNS